jgi:transcriptional regulator with XRE-family HTH domain
MTWGKRIAAARIAVGLTQEELAALVHVVQSAVAGYETERSKPNIAMFIKIAAATGVSPCWLAFGVGEGPLRDLPSEKV